MPDDPSLPKLSPDDLLAHTRWARRLARSLLGDDSAADDVVQETWAVALDGSPPTDRPLRAWLAGVLRYRAQHWHRAESRRRRRERAASREESLPSEEELVERAETSRALMREVLALDEPYRSTLLLRYIEECPPAEIARRRGVPAGTVRSQLTRGLALLRDRLDRRYEGRSVWSIALAPLATSSIPSAQWMGASSLAQGAFAMTATKIAVAIAGAALVGAFWLGSRNADEQASTSRSIDPVAETPALAEREHRDSGPNQVSPRTALTGTAARERNAAVERDVAPSPLLQGRLVDGAGAPISGARVLCAAREEQPVAPLDAVRYDGSAERGTPTKHGRFETVTDADGFFELRGPLAGPIRLAARADRFAPYDDDSRFLAESGLDVGEITLEQGVLVLGRVVDARGAGVAGAWVFRHVDTRGFGLPMGLDARLAQTAADGTFRATLARGPWALRVESEAHPVQVERGIHVDPGETEIEIRLHRSHVLAGRVELAAAQATVDFERIEIVVHLDEDQAQPEDLLPEHRFAIATCTAEGRFEFDGLRGVEGDEPTRFKLYASRRYSGVRRALSNYVTATSGDTNVAIELFPYAEIRFELADAETNAPVVDPTVLLLVEGFHQLDAESSGALEGEGDGRYRVTDIARSPGSDEVHLRVQKEGFLDRIVGGIVLADSGVTDLGRVAMTRASTLDLEVVDAKSGEPIQGASVTAVRQNAPELAEAVGVTTRQIDFLPRQLVASTDAFGVATMRVRRGEETSFRVTHEDYATPPEFSHRPVGDESRLRIELEAGGALDVVVTDERDQPVAGVVVVRQAEHVSQRSSRIQSERAITAPSGTARFEHLSTGRHRVRLASTAASDPDGWREVVVSPGEDCSVELRFPSAAVVEGTIRQAGRPLAGAEIWFTRTSPRRGAEAAGGSPIAPRFGDAPPQVVSNSEGHFRLPPLRTGTWDLWIAHETRALAERVEIRVARDAPRLRIELDETQVEGRVTLASGTGASGTGASGTGASGTGVAGVDVFVFAEKATQSALYRIANGWAPAAHRSELGRTTSDANGRFVLYNVPADTPLLLAAHGPGVQLATSGPFQVRSGDAIEGIELQLAPAGTVLIELQRPDDSVPWSYYRIWIEPVDAQRGSTRRTASPQPDGTVRIDHLSPGDWTVRAVSGIGTETVAGPKTFAVTAAEVTRVSLEL